MSTYQTYERGGEPDLVYVKSEGREPTILFLGGFASDMDGTKATYLEEQCRKRSQAFLRFDYSGHGRSEGAFEEGTIGSWRQDALEMVDYCTDGPLIVVGSSMGGWIGLLVALARPKRVQGLVGIAAAPDFTRWMKNKELSEAQLAELQEKGQTHLPNDYGDPYVITRNLIEDGENWSLLDNPIELGIPVRLLQGKQDTSVPWETAEHIAEKLTSEDVEVILIDDGDHSLSRDQDLEVLSQAVFQEAL